MLINGRTLLDMAPIRDMVPNKVREHGVSYGLGEAGYDIRLKQSVKFVPMKFHTTGTPIGMPFHYVDKTYFKGNFALASAIEQFQMPEILCGVVHDKSTWARHGLSVLNTVIEPGWHGYLTLELVYHGSEELVIPAGAGIAQVLFHRTSCAASYDGKYQNQEDKPIDPIMEQKYTGDLCSECHEPQFDTPAGVSCPNGHGGADPLFENDGPVKIIDFKGVYPSSLDQAVKEQARYYRQCHDPIGCSHDGFCSCYTK